MRNIVWRKPCGGLAITSLIEASDPIAHAAELQARGDLPPDWVAVGYDIPEPKAPCVTALRWVDGRLVVDPAWQPLKPDRGALALELAALKAKIDTMLTESVAARGLVVERIC